MAARVVLRRSAVSSAVRKSGSSSNFFATGGGATSLSSDVTGHLCREVGQQEALRQVLGRHHRRRQADTPCGSRGGWSSAPRSSCPIAYRFDEGDEHEEDDEHTPLGQPESGGVAGEPPHATDTGWGATELSGSLSGSGAAAEHQSRGQDDFQCRWNPQPLIGSALSRGPSP